MHFIWKGLLAFQNETYVLPCQIYLAAESCKVYCHLIETINIDNSNIN